MHQLDFNTWQDVSAWCQINQDKVPRYTPEQICDMTAQRIPRDAFSIGQVASKTWLCSALSFALPFNQFVSNDVAYVGSWVGTLVPFLTKFFCPSRVFGFDADPDCAQWSELYNQEYVRDNWTYKAVITDAEYMDFSEPEFEVSGELITDFRPLVVVNTSSEHMSNNWFNSLDESQLVIMQTNSNPSYDGHINTCESITEMADQYPMQKVLYTGEMRTPDYTRYMQIGYPA